jgi:hypothetical protein
VGKVLQPNVQLAERSSGRIFFAHGLSELSYIDSHVVLERAALVSAAVVR